MADHQPGDPKLQGCVLCCRTNACHDKKKTKLYIRLARNSAGGYGIIEETLTKFLEAQGERLYGQAPKGSLEREAQQLLDELLL